MCEGVLWAELSKIGVGLSNIGAELWFFFGEGVLGAGQNDIGSELRGVVFEGTLEAGKSNIGAEMSGKVLLGEGKNDVGATLQRYGKVL